MKRLFYRVWKGLKEINKWWIPRISNSGRPGPPSDLKVPGEGACFRTQRAVARAVGRAQLNCAAFAGGMRSLSISAQLGGCWKENIHFIFPLALDLSLSSVPAKLVQSRPTLCNPMEPSPPGSSVHGILQARILEWVAISSPRGSCPPRDQTQVSYVSCIGRRIHYH